MINDFAATPDAFLGLETSCPDSDPFDNFILTCTASKPAIVIPDLTVVWYHNGSLRNGMITSQNGGTNVTNTLRFPNSFANDSGNYRCQARLDLSMIDFTKDVSVTIKCKNNITMIHCYILFSSTSSILSD